MTTKRAETTAENIVTKSVDIAADSPRDASDVFDGIGLHAPLLQLAQKTLGPFLTHRGACLGECTCGLRAAVEELKRHEQLVQRYGVAE